MPQLSASRLRLFQECPRCFWLDVKEDVERPRGPFPSLPSGMDRILKAYFDQYRKLGTLPPLVAGKLDGTLSHGELTLGFNDPATKSRLWGKLDDCLVLADARLAPLDHKTRASAPEDVSYSQKYYQLQMDVYTLLLERSGHRTSRTAYVVYYYPVGGALHEGVPFQVTVHRIETEPEQAYAVFQAACRCLAGPRPPCAPRCEYCAWARTAGEATSASAPARPIGVPRARPAGKPAPSARPPGSPDDLFG
jgi:hypothetical protein